MRQFAEVFRRRPRDRFGGLDVGERVAGARERFGQDHQISLLFRCFFDESRELAATVHGALAVLRPIMDCGKPHFAGRRSRCFGQRYIAPFRTGSRCPAEIKLDDRFRGL